MFEGKYSVWVVDDDLEIRMMLGEFLGEEGFRPVLFSSAVDAIRALEVAHASPACSEESPDVILSDLNMGEMDGMAFLRVVRENYPEIPLVLVTAFGTVDNAIAAIRNGAYDFLIKPFKLDQLSLVIERALEKRDLTRDNQSLRGQVKERWRSGAVLGKSPAMQVVFDLVKRVAPSLSNVLIHGESGTGKEMIARLIHDSGPRKEKPFVAINCTAIPEALLESELFGHAKGAFTGAVQRKIGLFEEAQGGTIFLDEIGDMSPSLQAKLLRVIQERKIRPVGDNALRNIDVRLISATHRDLKEAIKLNNFREDLYYRLSVIPIAIPPLRQRKEDIPILVEHFITKYAAANGSPVKGISKLALSKLLGFRWEGNVRELENVIERCVVLCRGTQIGETEIEDHDRLDPNQFFSEATSNFPSLNELENRYIRFVLEKTSGKKDRAAQILGINRRTLYRKEKEMGLDPIDLPICEQEESGLSC